MEVVNVIVINPTRSASYSGLLHLSSGILEYDAANGDDGRPEFSHITEEVGSGWMVLKKPEEVIIEEPKKPEEVEVAPEEIKQELVSGAQSKEPKKNRRKG